MSCVCKLMKIGSIQLFQYFPHFFDGGLDVTSDNLAKSWHGVTCDHFEEVRVDILFEHLSDDITSEVM